MEVILNQDVDKIGKAGVIVKVKDGFARNFLLPQGLAVLCTPLNLQKFKQAEQRKAQESEKVRLKLEELRKKLAGLSLTMPALVHSAEGESQKQGVQEKEEKLYGSISSLDIANALKEEGIEIDKESIVLEEPIKALGIYEVSVKLHPQISANLKVWVVKK
ncbi:MAG: 50S ribosomal protein L9 [Candidatus Omnitrophota bacterium]|nr:50S ribosomal protein L9 [Candidatus Omnitrophota bacterium]